MSRVLNARHYLGAKSFFGVVIWNADDFHKCSYNVFLMIKGPLVRFGTWSCLKTSQQGMRTETMWRVFRCIMQFVWLAVMQTVLMAMPKFATRGLEFDCRAFCWPMYCHEEAAEGVGLLGYGQG